MAYYTVFIKGDRDQAAGLLAKAGIQSTGAHSYFVGPGSDTGAGIESTTARLAADTADAAREKVVAALGDEPFTVEESHRFS